MPPCEDDLLRLVHWLGPAFPTGAFAWSHGLETAIARGEITSAALLRDWLAGLIGRGTGRMDAALCLAALRGTPAADLTDEAAALAVSAERWAETREQGAAFVAAVNAVAGLALPVAPLPVAVGLAARGLGVGERLVLGLYLQGFVSAQVLAAIRAVPLGQAEGHRVIADLAPVIAATVDVVLATPRAGLGSAVFGADLAAMEHEVQEVRLFRS